jgi:hypothetical protein
MSGEYSTNGEMINVYNILVIKPEGKRLFGRTRRRWVDNVTANCEETVREDVDWTDKV